MLCPYDRPPLGLSFTPLSRILTYNVDGKGYGGEAMDWKQLLAYITGTVVKNYWCAMSTW